MEKLAYVLWLCLWPLTCSINTYLSEKLRLMTGGKELNKYEKVLIGSVQLIIWVKIAKSL